MRWILVLVLAAAGCNQLLGGRDLRRSDASVSGDDGAIDAIDAPSCTPGPLNRGCSNCIDDDSDGTIDSLDMACTTPSDNDEAKFSTNIPGDNVDSINQDCFFDGNSGAGDDGCQIHVCCLLGATSQAACTIGANQYNPAACPPPIGTGALSQSCRNVCGALTVPGCDCFGCCTLCDPVTKVCRDVAIHPLTSPDCTPATIDDPGKCRQCTQVPSCGREACGDLSCVLCPGQTPGDLPAACGGVPSCPSGSRSCVNDASCPAGTYCHAGSRCCIGFVSI